MIVVEWILKFRDILYIVCHFLAAISLIYSIVIWRENMKNEKSFISSLEKELANRKGDELEFKPQPIFDYSVTPYIVITGGTAAIITAVFYIGMFGFAFLDMLMQK